MHFSNHLVAILAAAVTSTNAAPDDSPESVTSTTSADIISGDKMGAATFVDGYNGTYIVYQASDTSITGLSGNGHPVTESTYTSSVVLAAGVARNDTPLALATVYSNVYNIVHMFYLNATECGAGNYLNELVKDPYQGWINGPLNSLQICSSNASNLLYALGPFQVQCTTGSYVSGLLRVGYMSNSNYLTEVYQDGIGGWGTALY